MDDHIRLLNDNNALSLHAKLKQFSSHLLSFNVLLLTSFRAGDPDLCLPPLSASIALGCWASMCVTCTDNVISSQTVGACSLTAVVI